MASPACNMCGDLNATISVNRLHNLLENGHEDAGSRTAADLPVQPPFLPVFGIDHVLTRGGVVGTQSETLLITATDHRALLAAAAVPRTS